MSEKRCAVASRNSLRLAENRLPRLLSSHRHLGKARISLVPTSRLRTRSVSLHLSLPLFIMYTFVSPHTLSLYTPLSYSQNQVSFIPATHFLPPTLHTMSYPHNELVKLTEMPEAIQRAAKAAAHASTRAYAPYSNFGVGAALLHTDDSVTEGCNYENCTLQACCAERCAIVRANVEGRRTAKAVAVYGKTLLTNVPAAPADAVCTPCGLCRQLLVEVADLSQNFESFEVILVTMDQSHVKVVRLADLLPMKFGPADIGMDLQKLSLA